MKEWLNVLHLAAQKGSSNRAIDVTIIIKLQMSNLVVYGISLFVTSRIIVNNEKADLFQAFLPYVEHCRVDIIIHWPYY
jgi:hypothetical protein